MVTYRKAVYTIINIGESASTPLAAFHELGFGVNFAEGFKCSGLNIEVRRLGSVSCSEVNATVNTDTGKVGELSGLSRETYRQYINTRQKKNTRA